MPETPFELFSARRLRSDFVNNADLLWTANVEAGAAELQHRDEEGHFAARLPAERRRPMEQELSAAQPVQRHLHMDQHAANGLPEPEADTRQPEPAEVSFQGRRRSCASIATRIGR